MHDDAQYRPAIAFQVTRVRALWRRAARRYLGKLANNSARFRN